MLHYENNVGYNLIWINSTRKQRIQWGGTQSDKPTITILCVRVFAGIQEEKSNKKKNARKKTTKTYHMQSINTGVYQQQQTQMAFANIAKTVFGPKANDNNTWKLNKQYS